MMRLPWNRSFFLRSLGAVFLLGTLGVVGAALAADRPSAPLQRLPAPDKAAAAAHAAIQGRMARHGNTMSSLVKAIILLDRPTILTLAGRIADEEVVARIEGKESEKLRTVLPPEFFAEQDDLRNAARDLAAAAAQRNSDIDLADRFATVARTCVKCHSVYLRGRVELPALR
jgi:hypothetical protein